jgi:hypothetical protein
VSGRVGDARAGRAHFPDILLAVVELGGDGGSLGGGASEELEAERGSELSVPLVDEVAVAVILLAVRVLPGLGKAGGRDGQSNGGLHYEIIRMYCGYNSEGTS